VGEAIRLNLSSLDVIHAFWVPELECMLAVAAVLFLVGGLIQINPIWQWGPDHPTCPRTAPSPTGTSGG
jgi:hypothetical protein